MSRAYELHMNGDCNDFCPVCEHEELNPPEPADEEEEDD